MSRMAPKALLLALALAAAAAAGTAHSGASFSTRTANPGASFAAAESFPCTPGSETVTAGADAYVDELLSVANFGSSADLFVRALALNRRRSLIRFELPEIPASCSLGTVTLRVFATAAQGGRTIEVRAVVDSWTESGVTWLDQPGTTGAAATSASGSGWRTWAVTAQVAAMYSGSNNGFQLRDASETPLFSNQQAYSSREGSNPPELVVTWE